MKKTLILVSLLAMLVVMSGCKDKKASTMENTITTESAVTTEVSVIEPAVENATMSAVTTESIITTESAM